MAGAALRENSDNAQTYQVAHDLSRFDPRSRVRDAVRAAPAPGRAADALPRGKTAARALPRVYVRISPVVAISFLIAVALMLLVVFGYMQLSVIAVENNALANELSALQKEEKELRRQIEAMTDIGSIESYAVQELGMIRPDRADISYINLAGEDYGIVYQEESLMTKVKNALSGFWESVSGLLG